MREMNAVDILTPIGFSASFAENLASSIVLLVTKLHFFLCSPGRDGDLVYSLLAYHI